ncbi:hypothetical protein D9M71_107620 [compost metagenome]
MAVDLELVVLGHQLEVVVDVVEQRDATGFVVGTGVNHAVAVVLGLAIGQRQAVLAEAVGALQQVAIAVHFTQGRLAGVVGEEGVDALGLEAGAHQGESAHLGLHAVAQALGGDGIDVGIGVFRRLVGAVDPGVDLRTAQIEFVGDFRLEARVFLVGLAGGAVVVGVHRVHDAHGGAQAVGLRAAVGDLRGRERIGVAAADVAEGHTAAIHQAEGIADLAVTGEQLIEQDVGAGEQAEVLAHQHLAPVAADGAVELADVDGSGGAVGFAVVDGDPEGGTGAKLEVVHLLAHVETYPVGQEAHLHPRLAAVELLALAIHVAVDIEGVDVAVGGEGGLVLVVQDDLRGGLLGGQGNRCRKGKSGQTGLGDLLVVHGALRCG